MAENPFARDPAVTVGVGADTSGFGRAIDGAIGKLGGFKKAVAGVGLALGAVAAGGLAKATQAAANFEEQMVEVEKVTDPETAAAMGDAIQEMASEMPLAQDELAGIAEQAGRFGIEGEENMRQFTESVSRMAVATDLSASEAGEAFARMTTLMDEPIENVEKVGSVVNELSNTMATSASEITNAATRSSGALNQLGLSSEEIMSLNATMNEVSASSRIAGTRLRRFAQELQDPGKVEDLAGALGMSAEEFKQMREESPNQLIEEMAGAFDEGGESADALRSALSSTSRQTLSGLAQNLDGLADAQDAANGQMEAGTSLQEEYDAAADTFNARMQVLRNRFQNIAIQIGENLLPVAADLLSVVNDAIGAFSEWNSRTNGMVGTVSLVAGALGGFAAAGAATVSMLGGMTAVLTALGTAFTVLTGPIGIAIAAVALLAGAWTSNIFGIRDKTQAAFSTIVSTVRKALTVLQEKVIGPVLDGLSRVWARHGDDISKEIDETMAHIRNVINTVLAALKPIIDGYISLYTTAWNMFGDEIMTVVKFAFDFMKGYIETAFDAFLTAFRVGMALIRGDWGEAWDLIAGFAERTLDGIIDFAEKWGPRLKDALVSMLQDAGRAVGDAFANAFNSAVPDEVGLPSTTIAGQKIGGGSLGLPQLNTGGFIEEGGLAMLHAGERVVPAAQVDREQKVERVIERGQSGASGEMLSRLDDLINEVRSSGGEDIVLQVGERELARTTADAQDSFITSTEINQ